MQLPDSVRHLIAVALACGGFLLFYLGLDLVWWAALALAVVLYGAGLLMIGRAPTAAEIMVAPRVSAADLNAAGQTLEAAATQVARVTSTVPEPTGQVLTQMSEDLRAIAGHVRRDPEDYRKTRRFVHHYLPLMLQTIQSYGALAGQSAPSDRLGAISDRIEGYGPVVSRINAACLDNDFEALEAEVAALDTQLSRRLP